MNFKRKMSRNKTALLNKGWLKNAPMEVASNAFVKACMEVGYSERETLEKYISVAMSVIDKEDYDKNKLSAGIKWAKGELERLNG